MATKERVSEAVEALLGCLNSMGGEREVVDQLVKAISFEHRTIQTYAVQALVRTLRRLSTDNRGTDARNEDAIAWCKALASSTDPVLGRDPVGC